ncbi:hypothetical protein LDDCCGHA_6071 [Methylobacterium oxalidis]|nr:hypothetical protein LDDCCGHA_6071 [Methylobacterium oxalidis]
MLPDQQSEMRAAGALGRQGDQASHGRERNGLAAAEDAGIEACFSEEAVKVGAEFHQDGADRPHDIGMDEADRGRRLSPVSTLVCGRPIRAAVGAWSDRREHSSILPPVR